MVSTDANPPVEDGTPKAPEKLFGIRHVQSLLMFLCLTVAYALRVDMSVAIVAMVEKDNAHGFETYDWDESTKSLILSSFFWGYVITQIPSAQIVKRFGAYVPLLITMATCSIFTVVTPFFAPWGWGAVAATRVIEGLCQGFFFPTMHTLLAKWIPTSERGRLGTFVYAGSQFGTILALPIGGVLASSRFGWPSIFYTHGAAGIVWSILWFFFGSSSPAVSKSITEEEKKYIESSLGTQDAPKKINTPWLSIFTSLPMWSLIIVHCGNNWGFWTLLTEMPTYMKGILGFDIKKNGFLSALPYLAMWLLSFVFSFASDTIINRKICSVAVSRKIANTIGHWIPACALIGLAYVTKGHQELAVGLLTIAVGFNSAVYVGFQVNHIDLAPNHAGTMMGITNCAANVMSIIAPLFVGLIVTDTESSDEWKMVFFIAAGIYFVGNTIFLVFGSADIQEWNEPLMPKTKDIESPDDKSQAVANEQIKQINDKY